MLCGACRRLLSIDDYVRLYQGERADLPCCPRCAAPFNPGCRKHLHLYFDIDPARHRQSGSSRGGEAALVLMHDTADDDGPLSIPLLHQTRAFVLSPMS